MSAATGIARATIRSGRNELKEGNSPEGGKLRRAGAGRPRVETTSPGVTAALERLVDPATRGDPESPLKWTSKSKAKLAAGLRKLGFWLSSTTVGRILQELGYSLQAIQKGREGLSNPDRDRQFENIAATAKDFLECGEPAISVDTKKKELVGDFKNAGQEWQPKGEPERSLVHDFPSDATGKAIPYGIYDMARNEAYVNVGCDHDTSAFAVASIRRWWVTMGRNAYPEAESLLITADAGGSNGYRSRAWKVELQKFASEFGLTVQVCHFPPGTSKWNKIEHRLFCHITKNWRGRRLLTFETIVDLIGSVRTGTGLKVRAKLDERKYPKGIVVTDSELSEVQILKNEFRGEWNYTIQPSQS